MFSLSGVYSTENVLMISEVSEIACSMPETNFGGLDFAASLLSCANVSNVLK